MHLHRHLLASWTMYAAVVWVYFVLPDARGFGTAMLGTALFQHDAILNAGILEWGRQALISPSLHVFDWTAGFPLGNTLANTENLLGWQPFYSALRASGFTVTFSYNSLIVLSYLLSAIGAQLLAGRFGASRGGAFLAGIIFAFVPFHLVHIIHLQTLAICWVPFAIYFLDRFLAAGGVFDLAALAVSVLQCVLSGLYIGFFLALALPLYALLALVTRRAAFDWRRIAWLATAGLTTAVALWPVFDHYVRYARTQAYSHPVTVLTRFSLELFALAKYPWWLWLWDGSTYSGRTEDEAAAFPGITATLLFIGAIVWLWRAREIGARSRLVILLTPAAAFFLLALGPRLMVWHNTPVAYAEWIPLPGRIFELFSVVRWPMRAYLFSLLFGAVVAALGYTVATRTLSRQWRAVVLSITTAAMLVEYRPITAFAFYSAPVPDPLAMSEAYPFLASESDRGGVVELPTADAGGYRTPMMVRSTYGSAGHLRRVVAIHGQALPELTAAILSDADGLPDPGALDRLRKYGISRVVVHRNWTRGNRMETMLEEMKRSGLPVLWESDEAVIFALK